MSEIIGGLPSQSPNPRSDPPFGQEASRAVWIGWGFELVLVVVAAFIRGPFLLLACACFGVVMIIRGLKPGLFAHHFEERIIEQVPYRRKESVLKWLTAALICTAISGTGNFICRKYAPAKGDSIATILDGVQRIVHQELNAPRTYGKSSHTADRSSESAPPPVHPSLNLCLALITTIHRLRDPGAKGYMKGGGNDLVGVLRVQQRNGTTVRHVQSLQVVGNIAADFGCYVDCFSKGNGTETTEELEERFNRRRPFFRLSWVVFPNTKVNIDPNDEEFLLFEISHSVGVIGMPAIGNGPRCQDGVQDAFGFEDTNQQPKYPFTYPTWSHLVRFRDTNPSDFTGRLPVLRDEVRSGKVKIQANIDGEIVDIPPSNIRLPWPVSLEDGEQEKMLPQKLFYGIDDSGNRMAAPTPVDPLVKAKGGTSVPIKPPRK